MCICKHQSGCGSNWKIISNVCQTNQLTEFSNLLPSSNLYMYIECVVQCTCIYTCTCTCIYMYTYTVHVLLCTCTVCHRLQMSGVKCMNYCY